MELTNKQGNVTKIFASEVDDAVVEQLQTLIENEPCKNSQIRIMPNVQQGRSSVVGFTCTFTDKVIPNFVGVDIACGVLVVKLGKTEIDLPQFDEFVKKNIPGGLHVRQTPYCEYDKLEELYCYSHLSKPKRLISSLGTLGGGNHFVELDKNEQGEIYLVIHAGSRNLGKQVTEFYQDVAVERNESTSKNIRYKRQMEDVPSEQCYLFGIYAQQYLHDVAICMDFATKNREIIAEILVSELFKGKHLSDFEHFETVHNYMDLEHGIIRKGAVSAQQGERLIITLNMKDGSLICVGKGNEDWNCSAPSGAGRVLSRKEALKTILFEDYQKSMEGIYTTCVTPETIGNAPMAYKPTEDVTDVIQDTVEITEIIKPIYNFKATNDTQEPGELGLKGTVILITTVWFFFLIPVFVALIISPIATDKMYGGWSGILHGMCIVPNYVFSFFREGWFCKAPLHTVWYNVWWWIFLFLQLKWVLTLLQFLFGGITALLSRIKKLW